MSTNQRSIPDWLYVVAAAALLLLVGTLAARSEAKSTNIAAPMPEKAAKWEHAPYAARACNTCHVSSNPRKPGRLKSAANKLCVECHDEFLAAVKKKKHQHDAYDECTNCHNAHNALDGKLLLKTVPALCFECHDDIGAATKHPSGSKGKEPKKLNCAGCHDPHAAKTAKLLK